MKMKTLEFASEIDVLGPVKEQGITDLFKDTFLCIVKKNLLLKIVELHCKA